MGDFTVCPVGSGGGAGAAGAAAGICCGIMPAMGCMCGEAIMIGCPATWRLMRTFSSPSVISISPIPDSWTRSMSFFSFLRSMFLAFRMFANGPGAFWAPGSFGAGRQGSDRRLQCQLVSHRAQPGDHAGGDVREIGVAPERLA